MTTYPYRDRWCSSFRSLAVLYAWQGRQSQFAFSESSEPPKLTAIRWSSWGRRRVENARPQQRQRVGTPSAMNAARGLFVRSIRSHVAWNLAIFSGLRLASWSTGTTRSRNSGVAHRFFAASLSNARVSADGGWAIAASQVARASGSLHRASAFWRASSELNGMNVMVAE